METERDVVLNEERWKIIGEIRCRVSVMGGDAADGVGRRRSDQRWMGTIQEAVTCGRFKNLNRRQETGSTPHRDVMTGSFMPLEHRAQQTEKQQLCRSRSLMDLMQRHPGACFFRNTKTQAERNSTGAECCISRRREGYLVRYRCRHFEVCSMSESGNGSCWKLHVARLDTGH